MSTSESQAQDPTVAAEPVFSSNAMTVLRDRYLMRSDNGQVVETPSELFRRVARVVAAAEKTWGATDVDCGSIEEKFYDLMVSRAFLPNSPTLMNAGRRLGMLSACFVLPVGDSMEEIFETIKNAARRTPRVVIWKKKMAIATRKDSVMPMIASTAMKRYFT